MKQNHHNYLPDQYKSTDDLKINHNYLKEQFSDSDEIFNEIKTLVRTGDFTLGKVVDEFEIEFSKVTKTKFCVGVGSGTDAIFLSLKALGIEDGDEIITPPYTFYATIGAIVTAGASPVFVDIGYDYNIDVKKIESAITSKTRAIIPVHWSGLLCNMEKIHQIATKHNLLVVEDACHAINAERNKYRAGNFSNSACFSMHPLKNLNVWGDAGVIATNSENLYNKLLLYRNHGLINRDICEVFAYNSRLDSIQAIVGKNLLRRIDSITNSRINNANYFDKNLSKIPQITIPQRDKSFKQVFHLYIIQVEQRDELQKYLISNGIDAKIHYPLPMHLQPASKEYGYEEGDFPIAEEISKSIISLPVHEYISKNQQNEVIEKILKFYE